MTTSRIMIVEDERITAEDLQEILTELGYEVTAVVSNAEEAFRQAERTSPHLVLMDIHIEGDIDGVCAARMIRERFGIPTVYLTAHADRETLSRAKEAEPLGYLIKPFQEAELQASIEMALHKDKMDRQAREREERLTATLRGMGEGVITVDQAGIITFLNQAAEEWTGWKQQDAQGQNIEQVMRLISSEARSPVQNPLRRAAREGVIAEMEGGALLLSHDGAEQAISGHAAPIWDHDGNLSGAVLVFGSSQSEPMAARQVATAERGGPSSPQRATFDIVCESESMRRLIRFVARIAASEATTILLEGESGTGKDVLARYLHHNSRREAEAFVAINCAAIPETLLESELFGYEKGAFTDARTQKRGILELGTGGTVFLDEIGELPLLLQAKLLRVLEEQSFRRLGGVKDIQVDLRVIAATNRSLSEAMRDGKFRMDLYYRLNVIQLVIPPLRERREDILPLADHFIRFYNPRFRREIKGISPEAARALLAHDWPGNVRELRNAIERAMVLEETTWLQPASLGVGGGPYQAAATESIPPQQALPEGISLEEAEKSLVLRALAKTGWNQTRAARLLNVTRDTLRYKMKKFDLSQPPKAETP